LSSRSQKALYIDFEPPQRQSLGKPVSITPQSIIDKTFNHEQPIIDLIIETAKQVNNASLSLLQSSFFRSITDIVSLLHHVMD
jgi:hypothetical protein